MATSKFLTRLNLSPDERLNPPKLIGSLKTVQEWASCAVDSLKDNSDFLAAIRDLSPWAEAVFSAAKDSLAPVKFVVKLLDELTKIQDPEELARLACTLAYQSAAEQAIEKVGAPARAVIGGPEFDDLVEEVDFSTFTSERIVTHPFVVQSDRILQRYLPLAGFSQEQVDQIIGQIHEQLPSQFNSLIADGKSKEKFDPLLRWLQLPSDGRISRAALRRHGEYVSWVFNEAPVFQCEPYALADVCIDAECSKLTYGDLRDGAKPGRPKPNPFAEGERNGGRHPLLETVMGYIGDPTFREPIVIQGSAGCGKSTFTLRLADHLRREGLRPVRIRLRDVILGREFYTQLGEALSYEDDAYLLRRERFVPTSDPLQGGAVFQEEARYSQGPVTLCPYVLILDGWDEISVAVSEGFRQRVKELLLRIRSELLRRDRPTVRVILTGRPSDAIDECSEFFRDETPVLTVRTLNPTQLPAYAERLRSATVSRPLSFEGVTDWTFPDEATLVPVFDRYRQEFAAENKNGQTVAQTGVSAVLGYPLLLHMTFRLLAEPNVDRKELIESPAALLRRLTDFATCVADQPSDRQPGAKIQARLSGSDLRVLLRRTAAHMTILGQESISKAELEKRLKTSDLVGHIKGTAKGNLISALLVSFYFKGGNAALGCEFTHKAFREYLFAEEIVETLKSYARELPDDLPERPASLYWKEFDDKRRKAAEELALLLGPQWLSPEVVRYLGSLLEWETGRTYSQSQASGWAGETKPIAHEEWQRILTLLADLWDWWAEGVHLRPQPRENDDTGQIEWDRSLAERLVPKCRPLTANEGLEPIRTTTLDAHLGDALFRICSWVHWYLVQHPGGAAEQLRRFQGRNSRGLAFRPTGANAIYFGLLCSRISGAGWRPDSEFPAQVFARGIDLSKTALSRLNFDRADLEGSSFRDAQVLDCGFHAARLAKADFTRSLAERSLFIFASLSQADFSAAVIGECLFGGADLQGASFTNANPSVGAFYFKTGFALRVPARPNDFTGAAGIDASNPFFSGAGGDNGPTPEAGEQQGIP